MMTISKRTPKRAAASWQRSLALPLLFALILAATPAAAKPTPKQQAQTLYKRANKLFKRGMYLDALPKYRKARALYPSFKIDLNIGATLDAMGRRTEAASYFERFLIQSTNAPQKITNAAKERLGELKKKLGSVKLTSIVEGATVSVDGKAVGKTPMELPLYLEPGAHELKLEHTGHQPLTRKMNLAAGQHETLDLSPRPEAPPPPPPPPPVVDEAEQRRLQEQAQVRRSKTLWAYTTLGVGAALAVTAAVLYGVGASQGGEAHEAYQAATAPEEIEAHYNDVEAAKTKLVVGHVMLGLAAASLGVSIYHFLTRPAEERAAPVGSASTPGPRVTLAPTLGGLSLQGSF
jgi:tetratricopeptide (TPR) repeat protein